MKMKILLFLISTVAFSAETSVFSTNLHLNMLFGYSTPGVNGGFDIGVGLFDTVRLNAFIGMNSFGCITFALKNQFIYDFIVFDHRIIFFNIFYEKILITYNIGPGVRFKPFASNQSIEIMIIAGITIFDSNSFQNVDYFYQPVAWNVELGIGWTF